MTNNNNIKVLLVDDSPIAISVLQKMLATDPSINVVGTASNGQIALELIPKLNPDIICTDLHMPVMNGMELIKQIMMHYPRPILIVSISVQEDEKSNIFDLLEAGAVDVMPKPRYGLVADNEHLQKEFITKVRTLAGVKVIQKSKHRHPTQSLQMPPQLKHDDHVKIITIGASTGGPVALQKIFALLPANFAVPILCVQHIGEEFLRGFIEWLGRQTPLKVKISEQGEIPQAGTVYFPKAGKQLEIDRDGKLIHTNTPTLEGFLPSITVTFRSVASHYGDGAIGVLLTGMGSDGAEGMRAIFETGGVTIAQDETTSLIFGMPKQAIALGAAKYILPLDDIAPLLIGVANNKGKMP